jgi:teichuronic acid biosynthesis glycosyltransferase TuaC
MTEIRVLVVTNLWPYDDDPSYGCFVQSQMESLRPFGVDYSVLFINGRQSKSNYGRTVVRLLRTLRLQSFELVHAHMGLAGWVARCQFGLPLAVSFLGNDVLGKHTHLGRVSLYDRFLMTSSFGLARLAQAVIVKSEAMKRKLGLESAHIIPNGVDFNLFRPVEQQEARKALGLDASKQFVLFPYDPGRAEKRFDLIHAAVELVRKQYPRAEILKVHGVAHEKMPLYMNAANALVLASEVEGSPNTVKEALATNLPVVTVDVGDTAELLRGTQGNYLAPREPRAIADRIVKVLQSGGRAESRQFLYRLSIEGVAKQVMGVYKSLLTKRRVP